MPFQRLLDSMRAVRGVEAVAFLDSEGELILSSGGNDPETMKVVGAYQGIFLSDAARLGLSPTRAVCTMFAQRAVLTRALKDGYFISVVFSPDLNFGYLQFIFEELYRELEQEL